MSFYKLIGAESISWLDTVSKEGRDPNYVYEVNVPNDAAFDAQVAKLRNAHTWYFWPDGNTSTHCANSAVSALRAGGVKGLPTPRNPLLPNYVNQDLWLKSVFQSDTVRLPSAPW